MSAEPAIWITGIGALTPIGSTFAEISAALLAGRSGIREVTGFDTSNHPCRIAGQVSLPACPRELDATNYEGMFPLEKCAFWSSYQALQEAGLWADRSGPRIGLVLGLGAEWMQKWAHDARRDGDMVLGTGPSQTPSIEMIARTLGLRGPSVSVAAACASGNHALAQACHWLQLGWVDICLAGAIDVSVTPYSLAGFGNLRALSRRNDEPTAALRPFDRDRDGMVLGEGGAVFVLERADRPRSGQPDPLAEVAGIGLTSDAYHMVIPAADGQQAIVALRQALAAAEVGPEDVDYVNAHATGTPVGDVCETRILQTVFGSHCRRIPVSSTKSMTGHLISAAAAVEALACVTAIASGAIPPTVNLDNPDPQCDLCHVANQPRDQRVRVAISNSFGFGGHNTSLVLKRVGR